MDSGRTVEHGPCDPRGSFSLDLPPQFDAFFVSCVEAVLEKAGRGDVLGILLGGSLALGEGGIDRTSDTPHLAGDVDLLVVVSSLGAHRRLYSMRGELGEACEIASSGVISGGRVDVGVMLPRDLESMRPSPFVYDLRNHGVVLYGDTGLIARIPPYAANDIGGSEAMALLENRIASLLGSRETSERRQAGDREQLRYEISRVYTDICTAALCLSGRYESGYAARCRHLRESWADGSLALAMTPDLVERIAFWTRFKLSPSEGGRSESVEDSPTDVLWDTAARLALEWWMRCEGFLQDREGGGGEAEHDVELLLRRRNRSFHGGNLRAWRGIADGWPVRRKARLAAGLGPAIFRIDPVGYVREWCVRLLDRYARGLGGESVECPAGGYPHAGGSWEEATRATIGAWKETVYGTRDR